MARIVGTPSGRVLLEPAGLTAYDDLDIDRRLERWAACMRGSRPGGVSETVGYLQERTDAGHDVEMTEEVVVTERAVARVKCAEKAYWRVISRYYLGRLSFYEISRFFHVSEDGVKRLFCQAKLRIAVEIIKIDENNYKRGLQRAKNSCRVTNV